MDMQDTGHSVSNELYQECHSTAEHTHQQDEGMTVRDEDVSEFNQQHQSYPWLYQAKYSRFWQHYAAMQSWMSTYVMMHRNNRYPSVGYQYPTMNRFGTYPSVWPPAASVHWNSNTQGAFNQYDSSAPHYHHNAPQRRTHYYESRDDHEYSNDDFSEDESMDIEISQEMIDFFKTSQKFREERDRAKVESERADKASKKKRGNPMKAGDEQDCRAPVERPDEGRRKGMKVQSLDISLY